VTRSAVAVSLRGLTRRFGPLTAVDGLTLDVARGELFGIVGPDGAGKTTTLRMLAGVLRPSEGTAVVEGVDVATDPEGAKPHLAYMAQRFGLYEDLTVQENLDFYADLYRVPKADRPARLERLYHFSRLGEFKDRLAGKLSGGMKQKLSLSCCLIHHPGTLLLDEPTFGVDPISRRELWLILHEMVAEGITVVVSTSYLDEAERCDRVTAWCSMGDDRIWTRKAAGCLRCIPVHAASSPWSSGTATSTGHGSSRGIGCGRRMTRPWTVTCARPSKRGNRVIPDRSRWKCMGTREHR
jgi:ABC-2 type transport system ATP-binding protein